MFKNWCITFSKEKYVLHYENLQLNFFKKIELKPKKIQRLLEFNLWQWLKTYVEFKTRKRIEDKKMKTKMHKLLNNAVHSIVAIGHSEYKDVFLNKKCLRHSMNRIQSKDHKIGTYEIKKFLYHALMIKYTSKTLDMVD